MASQHSASAINKVTMGGILVSIGIVFGDIGTSPLYVYRAIIDDAPIDLTIILGALSCVFWTLTIQTTLKYVILTLKADNKGEGGIFSLYALIRRYGARWPLLAAVVGGSFLLADGIITPPISVSSAVEGLQKINSNINTVPIVIGILIVLFVVQQIGTKWIGNIFGPVMLVWFTFLGVVGTISLSHHPWVLHALNPYYAYNLLVNHPGGFWLLGGVFLCTTGAEALYSDMGHCGRSNIRVSWIYVKICLVLNYAGQASWLTAHAGEHLGALNPFYEMVPKFLFIFSLILATFSTVIASQALITGSFTLIGEAMRLNLGPKLKIVYPTRIKGQLYIPRLNWALMAGCIGVVLYFRQSGNMEAAYGLAVTLTMIMTTLLIGFYLYTRRVHTFIIFTAVGFFLAIELSFLAANMLKFREGGWITLLIGSCMVATMLIWNKGREIKDRLLQYEDLRPHIPVLKELSNDTQINKYATNLIYMTASSDKDQLESNTIYSILNMAPKRADVYWFIHVNVLDEPFAMSYEVETLATDDVYRITFHLGFKVEPKVNYLFRLAIEDMIKNKEVHLYNKYASLQSNRLMGDFRFVVLKTFMSYENDLDAGEKFIMNLYFWIRHLSIKDESVFGLDSSNVSIEKVPLIISRPENVKLTRHA